MRHIQNKKQKFFFQKYYSFNIYVSDKFQILKNMQKRIYIFKQVNQIYIIRNFFFILF